MTSTLEALLDAPPPLDATTRAEFEDDFLHQSTAFASAARKRAKHGLTHSRLRSVYWRLFLHLLDATDMSKWSDDLRAHRREYNDLLQKYNVKPATLEDRHRKQQQHDDSTTHTATTTTANSFIPPNPLTNPIPLTPPSPPPDPITSSAAHTTTPADLKINNPLSTAVTSPWQQYFHSTELSGVIKQDLDRTYAESGFYQSTGVQQLMANVLLVWAKLNPQYEYRQGMNELLAPIVLTVMRDNRTRSGGWQDGVLGELLDRHFAEHDVWALFNRLMAVMAPFFAKIDTNTAAAATKPYLRPRAQDTNDDLLSPPAPPSQSPILVKCHYIHHTLLAQHDPQLYKHLNSQDVQPQLYGLRWYRLLFAREFHVIDVCTVWDVLFSQEGVDGNSRRNFGSGSGGGFVIADYFTVAMLFYVRGQLLQSDNTGCLRRLLKFPPVEDMRALIDRALFFTAPQQIQRGSAALTVNGNTAGGVDLPSVQQEHMAIQKFIAEYGNELENSYLDQLDPLGPLKRTGQAKAAMLADGINKLRNKAAGHQHKSLPVALTASAVAAAPAPLLHSTSASNLTHTAASLSSPSSTAASPSTSTVSLLSPRPVSSTAASTASHSNTITVPFLSTVQHEMGEKLHSVIHTLTAEYGRVHRQSLKLSRGSVSGDTVVELSGAAKVEEEIHAQERSEQPANDGLNISVELDDAHRMNGHHNTSPLPTSNGAASLAVAHPATGFDLQLLSSSLAELKHIADVLLGRLTYVPQNVQGAAAEGEFELEGAGRPSSAGRDGTGNLQSPSAAHVFFAPQTVEDPKARLARLLNEKEAREQHQSQHHNNRSQPSHTTTHNLSVHIPPHSSTHSSITHHPPTVPFPPVKRNSLSVHPPCHTANQRSEPSSASPLSAPIRQLSSTLPPPPVLPVPASPSLFDGSGDVGGGGASGVSGGGNSSARALLSSLLGGEKRSVFED